MPVTPERLRSLPKAPGVYLMKAPNGEVLYVGKAKILANRVRSYFTGGDERHTVEYLVDRVDAVDTIVTLDERQAIILEADLIRKYKPRYNIRLKDDREYLLVRVHFESEWPRLQLVRRREDDGAYYVGPFAYSYELRTMLDIIRRTVPLRTCTDKVLHNRVRPCLEYQIKRCAGPCCFQIDRETYLGWVKSAIQILEGKNREVAASLRAEMERASEEWRFEDAAELRDRIEILETVNTQRNTALFGNGTFDAFALFRVETRVEIVLLMVRRGRLLESRAFSFAEAVAPNSEILSSLVLQYYSSGADLPTEILIPSDFDEREALESVLSERAGKQISLSVPQRGSRLRLLRLAEMNARESYAAATNPQTDDTLKILQSELGLEEMPRTIECVDVSHFQGGSTVGSLVVFQDGEPDRSRYRTFRLSQEGKPDDFASMRELIFRHLSRAQEENTLSDLMVIDGGPQQLAQGLEQRRALSLSRPILIGLAKKRRRRLGYKASHDQLKKPERVYVEGSPIPIILPPNSPALRLLERIRDETHRTAVGFHRRVRAKRMLKSALDQIPGIGPLRKQKLLKVFGSAENVKNATAEEIAERTGFPLTFAQRILALLNREKISRDDG